ncbi:MAG: type II toxin-antitoxin system RelE/ParE family toxin [Bacteroidales bacterium]
MGIKVLWTETALNNLENIFEYYKYKESITIARKIVKRIVQSTIRLQNFPRIGKKENLLIQRKKEFRFIIEGNYKIVYWIENENNIKIAAVFDIRQNPEKIKDI